MSTTQSTIDYILDQISAAGVMSARKMFGEYGLYCNDKLVGLICDDTLFLKITSQGRDYVGSHYTEGAPYQGAKPSMQIDAALLEDEDWLSKLVVITEKNLPTPKPKSPKKKRA